MRISLWSLLGVVLLCSACGSDDTDSEVGTPAHGEVALRLYPDMQGTPHAWSAQADALVNGINYPVSLDEEGVPIVYTDLSEDGRYTVIYPAEAYSRIRNSFVLPLSQFPAAGGSFDAAFCPMYGTTDSPDKVTLTPLCGVLRLTLTGQARIGSIRVEDRAGAAVAGVFPFDNTTSPLARSTNPQNEAWCVLNCAAAGEGVALTADGTDFRIVLPAGEYPQGLTIRVSDRDHRAATFDIATPSVIKAGEETALPTLTYAPDPELLFAESFDNCVWGTDCTNDKGGYGVTAGGAVASAATASGTEIAYVAKAAGTPGSVLFESVDYGSTPAASQTLAVRRDYLRNRNLYDWTRLFYGREYRGALGGGDVGKYGNRGILITPAMTHVEAPCHAELRLRICTERDIVSKIGCLAGCGVLLSAEIDGVAVDVDVATSHQISQSIDGITHTAVMLDPAEVESGKWHELRLRFGAVGAGTCFRIQPTVIRGAKNCFWIDDIELWHTAGYPYDDQWTAVEPTTQLGAVGEDVSRLRLQPSSTLSIGVRENYTTTSGLGMKWISPIVPSDETTWAAQFAAAEKLLTENGLKVWCMHLPYGARLAERNRDLCATGNARMVAVAYYTKAIRAVAALKPKNLLVHCNQTLSFDDGSSPESLAQSLHELQTVADQIGAHICVENMSYGVGADAAVLAAAVDQANAMGNHLYNVRIAMDTGHANLYVTRTQPGKSIVDWLRTAGTRIGQLHIHGNRGWQGSITDDHLMPGYTGQLGYADAIGAAQLWGAFYHSLLTDCRYRGPFTYEVGSRSFGKVDGEARYDNVTAPWYVLHNYNTYLYPAFRAYTN